MLNFHMKIDQLAFPPLINPPPLPNKRVHTNELELLNIGKLSGNSDMRFYARTHHASPPVVSFPNSCGEGAAAA